MRSKVVINNMPRNEIYASLRMMRMFALGVALEVPVREQCPICGCLL